MVSEKVGIGKMVSEDIGIGKMGIGKTRYRKKKEAVSGNVGIE